MDRMQLSGDNAIEIRPEVTMLSVLRHLNYKAWFAMAEFIDNALQSSISNSDRLKELHGEDYRLCVDIKIDTAGPGQILVTDNAAGISGADFPRAFRAAQIPEDRSGLSEFGMGMKSAACWFAETWSVRTKALGESVERTISFDIRSIVENKIQSLETTLREVQDSSHYTIVTLRGLHHIPQGRTVGKIRDHLSSIYRVFLREGRLVIRLNGDLLSYQTPAILRSVRYISPGIQEEDSSDNLFVWRKDVLLDFGEGQKVRGFAALREVGSTPLAGFALFRRGRLIEGSFDETYRPSYIFKNTNSYPYQRLFGELHVEGFEVSHTKDGFRWEEYEDIFLEHLKEEIEKGPLNLLLQAENYRALPSRKNIAERATVATNAVAEYVERELKPLLVEVRQNSVTVEKLPPELGPSDLRSSERTVEVNDGGYLWVITLRTSVDPAIEEWVAVAKSDRTENDGDEVRRLEIDLSLVHPFSASFLGANNENVELLLRIAASLCIALILAEDLSGEPPEAFLHHFNYIMRGAVSRMKVS